MSKLLGIIVSIVFVFMPFLAWAQPVAPPVGKTPTFTSVTVATEAYDADGWNGDFSVPTKDAVRDKVETLAGGHDAVTVDVNAGAIINLTGQEIGLDTQTANTVFAGPDSGDPAVPTFRALVAADIPDISASYQTPLVAGTDYQEPLVAGTDYLAPDGDGSALSGVVTAESDPTALLTAGTDNVKDTHVDWGSGANQVDLADIPGGTAPASAFDFNQATLRLPTGNADPTAAAGWIRHDSTVTNFTGGAVRYHNGSAIKQLLDMTAATAEACTGDQVVAYGADTDLWYCKDDATGAGGDQLVDIVATAPLLVNATTNVDNALPGSDADITFSVAAATTEASGVVELSTDAESVTGTSDAVVVTPGTLTARLAAPGEIGGTTAAAATFTTVGAGAGGFGVDADGDTTVKSLTVTASASPGQTAYDSDSPGADKTAGFLGWQYVDGADGSENSDWLLQVMQEGSLVTVLAFDESDDQFETTKAINSSGGFVGALTGNASGSAGSVAVGNITGAGTGVLTAAAANVNGTGGFVTYGQTVAYSATPVIDDPDNFAANFTGANLYGGTFIANAAGTAALPDPAVGMNFTVILEAAAAVIIDPLATGTADTITMNGLAAASDENITSSTLGAICYFQYRAANSWMATCNDFAEATPPE